MGQVVLGMCVGNCFDNSCVAPLHKVACVVATQNVRDGPSSLVLTGSHMSSCNLDGDWTDVYRRTPYRSLILDN